MIKELKALEQEEFSLLSKLKENKESQERINLDIFLQEKSIAMNTKIEFLYRKNPVQGTLVDVEFTKKKPSKLILTGDDGKELVIWETAFHTIRPVQ